MRSSSESEGWSGACSAKTDLVRTKKASATAETMIKSNMHSKVREYRVMEKVLQPLMKSRMQRVDVRIESQNT
jgi:hypothetical protein